MTAPECSPGWLERCRRSNGARCRCQCGGRNHGRHWTDQQIDLEAAIETEARANRRTINEPGTIPRWLVDDYRAVLERSGSPEIALGAAIALYLWAVEASRALGHHLQLMKDITAATGLEAEGEVLRRYFGTAALEAQALPYTTAFSRQQTPTMEGGTRGKL